MDQQNRQNNNTAENKNKKPNTSTGTSASANAKSKTKKKLSRAMSTFLIVLGLLALSGLLSLYILESANDFLGFSQQSKQVDVEVPENASLSSVTSQLKKEGVITQYLNFLIYANFKKLDDTIEPGTYTLDAMMSYDDIIYALRAGDERDDVVTVTIPEGFSVRDIAERLEENDVCTQNEFIEALNTIDFGYEFEQNIPDDENRYLKLEGYVFPDTYQFFIDENPESVARKFLAAFNKRVTSDYYDRMEEVGLTLDETLTLASIVQKEASNPEKMADVAEVFFNRLASSTYPRLESDVTVNYVENDIKPYLEKSNQAMYDAYNTYACEGLPVGPICNPGLDAINAVLYPSSHDYYFFISDEEGNYYYAETWEEHLANIEKAGIGGHGTSTQD